MRHRLLMVVDDDPRLRAFVETVFQGEAIQVLAANGGAEALAMVTEVVPDLILLDLEMPGLDGLKVCRKLRALGELSRVPIVLLGGHPDGEIVKSAYLAGADDFIAKPFSLATLEAKVEHWLATPHTPHTDAVSAE